MSLILTKAITTTIPVEGSVLYCTVLYYTVLYCTALYCKISSRWKSLDNDTTSINKILGFSKIIIQ